MLFKASAPGSLMLMGEYAVLEGYLGISAAIDKRIHVSITPRTDQRIILKSTLGNFETTISDLKITAPFEYALAAILFATISQGCEIEYKSEFSHTMGLGSSAAVVVATLSALYQFQNKSIDNAQLFSDCLAIIRQVQGKGSGADAAASIYGGIVCLQQDRVTETFTTLPEISVIYSGEKTTTTNAIKLIDARFKNNLTARETIYKNLASLAQQARSAIAEKNWPELGNLFNLAQQQMTDLGVSTPQIDAALAELNNDKNIFGAKISGSGLGDCVIGIGELRYREHHVPVSLSNAGVHLSPPLKKEGQGGF